MKMSNTTRWVIIIIGALSILAGIYFVIKGKSFEDYWLSFFSGVVLIGTTMIKEKAPEQEENSSIAS